MRLGLVVPNQGDDAVRAVRELPRRVEEWGFHSFWLTDHLVGVPEYADYGPGSYGPTWTEALSSLAYVAARTDRIRLGVGVLVAPYRDPVVAAKVLMTIDCLSEGRLDVGVGVGWARTEFEAVGRAEAFEARGDVTDDTLEVLTRCWRGGSVRWHGRWFDIGPVEISPPAVQQPDPPFFIGGTAPPALRRAARHGWAWHPVDVGPSAMARLGSEIDRLAGRPVQRTVRLKLDERDVGALGRLLDGYAAAGCDLAVVDLRPNTFEVVRRSGAAVASHVDRLAQVDGPPCTTHEA